MTSVGSRRLHTYPRVVLVVVWAAILINCLGARGWRGLGGQLLFPDFLVFYGAGTLFATDPFSLYDFGRQLSLQQSLIAPTTLPGTGPFVHPPYVAALLQPLSAFSYGAALVLWTVLSCAALCGAIVLLTRSFFDQLASLGLSSGATWVILLSVSATVLGLYSGQMHTFILLGSIAVIVLALRGHQSAAGLLVGVLAVKPQVAFAFGLLFLASGQWRACVAMAAGFAALNVPLVARVGLDGAATLYADYLETARNALSLPLDAGFPRSLLMTPYGLLAVVGSRAHQEAALVVSNVLAGIVLVQFVIYIRRLHARGPTALRLLFAFATVLPFLVFPYVMLYDSVLLLVAAVLIPSARPEVRVKTGAFTYAALWCSAPVSAVLRVPLGGLLAVGLWVRAHGEVRRLCAGDTAAADAVDHFSKA